MLRMAVKEECSVKSPKRYLKIQLETSNVVEGGDVLEI
jgi:hypothetical protein